ncbi:hypothetical protein ACWA7J_08530 [Leptothrix sp. BB-4]
MSRASPRRVQRAPERRAPRVTLPEVPVPGPALTLFDLPEAGAPPRRRGRPPQHGSVDAAAGAADTLREQPWPLARRRSPTAADDDVVPAVVVPETCQSLLRANDHHDLPCPLVANAYRVEPASGDNPARIHAKVNAPQRLREALRRPGLVARPIQLGTLVDPYLAVEREQRLTRALLEVLAEARHPVGLVSASPAIVRDLDLLADLASRDQALVLMRIAPQICPLGLVTDPATSESAPVAGAPLARRRGRKPVAAAPGATQREQLAASAWLQSLKKLAAAGVRVGVLLDLAGEGHDPAELLAPDADPDRRAAWLALFALLQAAGARLWRCTLPGDRLDDRLALADLAAQAGLSGDLPALDARPFVPPAPLPAPAPRQVTLF